MLKLKKLLPASVLLALFATTGHAASFDCNKAKTNTERTICQTRALNDADVKLVTTYNIVLHALPMGGRDAERDAQVAWLKKRNRCSADIACIRQSYQTRQNDLDDVVQNRILSNGPF